MTWLREGLIKLYGFRARRAIVRHDHIMTRYYLKRMAALIAARHKRVVNRLEKDRGLL